MMTQTRGGPAYSNGGDVGSGSAIRVMLHRDDLQVFGWEGLHLPALALPADLIVS